MSKYKSGDVVYLRPYEVDLWEFFEGGSMDAIKKYCKPMLVELSNGGNGTYNVYQPNERKDEYQENELASYEEWIEEARQIAAKIYTNIADDLVWLKENGKQEFAKSSTRKEVAEEVESIMQNKNYPESVIDLVLAAIWGVKSKDEDDN